MTRNLVGTVGLGCCVAVSIAACSAEAPVTEATVETSPASEGCGETPTFENGESRAFSFRVGELDREYLVHLPADYEAGRPTPLVLDFHGYTGTAPSEEEYTGLSDHADRHGYIVVYPQGTGFEADNGDLITSWNDLAGSASPGPEGPICSEDAFEYAHPPECGEPTPCNWATCHDDLDFVERLLDRLEEELCVDLDRVYATGMSNGGMFVHRLGCDLPSRFAAIAPVGGTLARGFACAADEPLAMMNVYGSQDIYVSQRGDKSSDGYFYESADVVMSKWADAQDCEGTVTPYPTSQDGVLGIACVQHANCGSGAEVVHCTWDGAHDWPQADEARPGNEIIWDFFEKQSRGGAVAGGEPGS